MATASDSRYVGGHHEERLRRFLAARAAGDEAGACRFWDELLTANFDRVVAMVRTESYGRLAPHEQDDAVSLALSKLAIKMIGSFEGSSMGEWVEATRTLVRFACIDVQRQAAAVSRGKVSLDQLQDDDGAAGQLNRAIYADAEKARQEADGREADMDATRAGQVFLAWALPQLTPKRRKVIELDCAGLSVEGIQEQLGMSRDAVYANRSRALKDLEKLRKQYKPQNEQTSHDDL